MHVHARSGPRPARGGALAVIVLFLALLAPGWAAAQINPKLSYQGMLRDASGVPVADSTYVLRFRLYPGPTGGGPLWGESDTVTTRGGLFSTILGRFTPFDTNLFAGTQYLEVIFAGDTLHPRTQLVSVPSAFRARYADTAGSARFAVASDSARATYKADSARRALFADTARATFRADTSRYAYRADQALAADSARHQLWLRDSTGYVRLSPPYDSLPVLIGTRSPATFELVGRLDVKGSDTDRVAIQFDGPSGSSMASYGLLGRSVSGSGAVGASFEEIVSTSSGRALGVAVGAVRGSGTAVGFEAASVETATGAAYGLNLPSVVSVDGTPSYGVYAENGSTTGVQYGVYGKVASAAGAGLAAEGSGGIAAGALKVINGAVRVSGAANQTAGTTAAVAPPVIGGLTTISVSNTLVTVGTRVIATVEGMNAPVPAGTPSAVYVVSVSNINPAIPGFDLQVTRVAPATAAAPPAIRVHWWLINP